MSCLKVITLLRSFFLLVNYSMFLDQDKAEVSHILYVDIRVFCLLCDGWKISDV